MSDEMEKAALAFDAESKPASTVRAPKEDNTGTKESLFPNLGKVEVDDESPEQGGGDDDPEEDIYKDDPKRKEDEDEDEDEDDEDKDESEDDEDEEEDSSEDKEFLSQDVQVTVDGEERTVKLKEALEGYIRTETFHKRMNEVDASTKVIQRAAADIIQNYEYTQNLGKQIEAHLESLIPKEPNWDEEFQKNPQRARELQKYYEQVGKFRNDLRAQMDDAHKKASESDRIQLRAFAEAESRKFDASNSKSWSDPKRKAKDLQAMRRTALSQGFSEKEISEVYDSRMLAVLLKASKYDRIMASRPQPIKRVIAKPVKPGAGSAKSRTAHRGISTAMKRLNQTGSIEDASVVMDELWRRSK
jgi:hypothetical protein